VNVILIVNGYCCLFETKAKGLNFGDPRLHRLSHPECQKFPERCAVPGL
jgi:hypothetical protein